MERLIFVDFDDTMCLYTHKIHTERFVIYPPEVIADKCYKESVVNNHLYKWLLAQQKEGTVKPKIKVITTACSLMLEAKKIWVRKHFPELRVDEFNTTSVELSKAEIINAYIEDADRLNTEVYFIDDSLSERHSVEALPHHVHVMSPQYISEIV